MDNYLKSLTRPADDPSEASRRFAFPIVLLGFLVLSLLNLLNSSGFLPAREIEWHDIVSQWFVISMMLLLIRIAVHSRISSRTFYIFFFGCSQIVWIMSIKFFGELYVDQTPLLEAFELLFAVSGLLMITWGLVLWSRDFQLVIESLRDSTDKYRVLSETDAMTHLLNRSRFDPTITLISRENHSLSLVLLDLDHFKVVNDKYGHPVGDQVIKRTAELLRALVRDSDFAFRLGGEEFALLYVHCPQDLVEQRAESIRQAISDELYTTENGESFNVTASFGIVHQSIEENAMSLYRRADAALYQAKSDGRDRIVVH